MPEVMSAISALRADSFLGLIYCILTAALITAMIHPSSATIGIVMGLGAAGVLDWRTAVAFSLDADLGTTITSWMASLNLSKNAKRAAYAHIAFNIIGVTVMLPLFFPSMDLLTWVMGWFGGDPGVPTIRDGKETFPLVPVAVGVYSTAFNVFNTALLFPFVGVFERVLARVGRTSAEDAEDYSITRFLDPAKGREFATGVPLVQQEMARYVQASTLLLAIARHEKSAPGSAKEHQAAVDILSRDIRRYTAAMFQPDMPYDRADLLASLIEEGDFTGSLGETLYQVARRVERHPFSPAGRRIVDDILDQISVAVRAIVTGAGGDVPEAAELEQFIIITRERCLTLGTDLSWEERGALLELVGSAERAFFLIDRIRTERRSVPRVDPGRFGFARQLADGNSSEGERRCRASDPACEELDRVCRLRAGVATGSQRCRHSESIGAVCPPTALDLPGRRSWCELECHRGLPRPAHRCCGRRRLSDHGHGVHPDAQVGAANENGRRTGLLQVVVGARITGSRAAWICPASIDVDRSGSRVLSAGVQDPNVRPSSVTERLSPQLFQRATPPAASAPCTIGGHPC